MNFTSLEAFAGHLVLLEHQQKLELKKGMRKVVQLIKKTARAEFGAYQPAVGNFSEWKPLAASTIEDRVRLGFTPNAPLLRTGQLRDSITARVQGLNTLMGKDEDGDAVEGSGQVQALEGLVGSTSDVMVDMELGTPKIPARAVLGPALLKNKRTIEEILGAASIRGLLPKDHIGAPKGPSVADYDQEF
jgi:hypothetical protein